MKLFSCAVLTVVLGVPALCQTPSADQAIALQEQAAQLAAQAAKIEAKVSADRLAGLDDKLANLQLRFGSIDADKLTAEVDAEMARAAEKVEFADQDLQFRLDSVNVDKITAQVDAQLARAAAKFDFVTDFDFAPVANVFAEEQMAFLQSPNPKPFPPEPPMAPIAPKALTIFRNRADSAYNAGTADLDAHKYAEAVMRFDSAIVQDPARADGALYWKAYALNRLGKRDEALAALAQLRKDYSSSPWLNDAQALEAEVKQNAGQPVSPAQETNDDLKLLAINSLMNADSERAIPLVEGILKGSGAPNVKDRALFVLSQSKAPRAQQALGEYAKGGGNPDLQLRAIQYVGMSGTKESQQQLSGIYGGTNDTRVKNAILQSLMGSRASDALLNIAKTEKDANLRATATRYVASMKSVPPASLVELYGSGADAQTKREIVNGLTSRREAKPLVELARKENDAAMKRSIVERLAGMTDNKDAMDYMTELLK